MPLFLADASAIDPMSGAVAPLKPVSKWGQIRAANTPTAINSSWEALRQNHEKPRAVTPSPDSNEGLRTEDRASEQAKFDQLLERERNIK